MTSSDSNEVLDFVNKRNIDEIAALSNEHKLIISQMPLVLEGLSSEAHELLDRMAMYQQTLDVRNLNKESVFISHAEQMLDKFKYQRHILHLTQLIKDRERKNERDRQELEKFRKELNEMKADIEKKPSVDTMQKEIIVVKGKVASYEKNITDAKKKEEKLDIKPEITPESLKSLIEELEALQQERDHFKTMADNITIARSSKKDLLKLKSATKHF